MCDYSTWLASDDDYTSTPLESLWGSTPPYQLAQAASRLPSQDMESLRLLCVAYRNAITTGDVLPRPPRPINISAALQSTVQAIDTNDIVHVTVAWTCDAPQRTTTVDMALGYGVPELVTALCHKFPHLRTGVSLVRDRYNQHVWHGGPSGMRGGAGELTLSNASTITTLALPLHHFRPLTTLSNMTASIIPSLWSIPPPPVSEPSPSSSDHPTMQDIGRDPVVATVAAAAVTVAVARATEDGPPPSPSRPKHAMDYSQTSMLEAGLLSSLSL